MTYPSGNRVNYSYDATGRVISVYVNPVNPNGVNVNTASFTSVMTEITRDASGNVVGYLTPINGGTVLNQRSFDNYARLATYSMGNSTGAANAAGVLRTLSRDNAGRIKGYSHTTNGVAVPALEQTFAYDNLDRLASATIGGVTTAYNYDATGNRTSKVVGGTTYTNVVSPTSNREVSVQDVGGTFNVLYDTAGNVTSDGVNSFTYSDRGRMGSAITSGGTVAYVYNGMEQRVSKTGPTALVPSGAAYYVYDESGQVLGEYDANAAPLYETIYLGTTPVGVMKQTGTAGSGNIAVSVFSVSTDHLGAPRIITRQSDTAIVWRWDSAESYGGSAASQDPNGLGVFVYNQRLPGQVFDAETGLFQNWHREYNPRIGRYMESDPLGLGGGINTYEYVGGAPTMLVDPTGEADTSTPGDNVKKCRDCTFSTVTVTGTTEAITTLQPVTVTGYLMKNIDNYFTLQSVFVTGYRGILNGGNLAEKTKDRDRNGNEQTQSCTNLPGIAAFEEAAQSAIDQNPANSYTPAWLRGIFIHSEFSRNVMAFPGYGVTSHVNVAYLDRDLAKWNEDGTSRPDAVSGSLINPNFVVELKTTNARMGAAQLSNYFKNLPRRTPVCEIYEKGQ